MTVSDEQKYKSWYKNHPINGIAFDGGAFANDREAVKSERQKKGGKKGYFNVTEMSAEDYTKFYNTAKSGIESAISKLHQGDVAAIPATATTKLPCEYCEYTTICKNKGEKIAIRITKPKNGGKND